MKFPIKGRFGDFGGRYIPETLVPAIEELEENYLKFKNDKNFKKELNYYLREYAGRPTPLYFAKNLTDKVGGAKILLKREDLLHGGAHKINNTLGQALLAKKMKKKRIIAETGAGQHGVATANTRDGRNHENGGDGTTNDSVHAEAPLTSEGIGAISFTLTGSQQRSYRAACRRRGVYGWCWNVAISAKMGAL